MTCQYSNPSFKDTVANLKTQLKELCMFYKGETDINVKPLEWQSQFRAESR